jgi:magnesium-transporting ATPase (P-type)
MSFHPIPADWPLERAVHYLKTDLTAGLEHYDAQIRLQTHHTNHLVPKEKELIWYWVAWKEMQEPLIVLLLFVGVLYALWGEWSDAIVVYVAIALVIAVEVGAYTTHTCMYRSTRITRPKQPFQN